MVRRIDPAADTFVKEAARQAREDGQQLARELALRKRLLLYAHGRLVSETSTLQRVAEYR